MTEAFEVGKNGFLKRWGWANLLGGLIGNTVTWIVMIILLNKSEPGGETDDFLILMIVWFPLFIGMAIAQWSELRYWNIKAIPWILTTVVGTFFSVTAVYLLINNVNPIPDGFSGTTSLGNLAIAAVGVGIGIGLFQAMVLHRAIANLWLWILAIPFELIILSLILAGIASVAFMVKAIFLNIFYTFNLFWLVEMRDFLLLFFLGISLPFVGALAAALPTGLILLRSFNRRLDGKSIGSNTIGKKMFLPIIIWAIVVFTPISWFLWQGYAGQVSLDYWSKGGYYYYQGQYEKAIELYNKAIQFTPQDSLLYSDRAKAYEGLGQYELAIADFNKAIQLDPKDILDYKDRGLVYQKMGLQAQADADRKKYNELMGNP